MSSKIRIVVKYYLVITEVSAQEKFLVSADLVYNSAMPGCEYI